MLRTQKQREDARAKSGKPSSRRTENMLEDYYYLRFEQVNNRYVMLSKIKEKTARVGQYFQIKNDAGAVIYDSDRLKQDLTHAKAALAEFHSELRGIRRAGTRNFTYQGGRYVRKAGAMSAQNKPRLVPTRIVEFVNSVDSSLLGPGNTLSNNNFAKAAVMSLTAQGKSLGKNMFDLEGSNVLRALDETFAFWVRADKNAPKVFNTGDASVAAAVQSFPDFVSWRNMKRFSLNRAFSLMSLTKKEIGTLTGEEIAIVEGIADYAAAFEELDRNGEGNGEAASNGAKSSHSTSKRRSPRSTRSRK